MCYGAVKKELEEDWISLSVTLLSMAHDAMISYAMISYRRN